MRTCVFYLFWCIWAREGALPFRRWYVCKAVNTPIFTIVLSQRPLSNPKTIFFSQNCVLSPNAKETIFSEKLTFCRQMTSNFWNFSRQKPIFPSNLELFSPKGRKILENFDNFGSFWPALTRCPHFFFFPLAECPWVWKSQPYTPISISYWSAPPPLGFGQLNWIVWLQTGLLKWRSKTED